MNLDPLPFDSVLGAFLLAFPALFSIVNPIGASLIFSNVTQTRSHAERLSLAKRISWYSLVILLGSLLLGGYILNFFGISLAALRIGGGLVVAIRAWGLLTQPEAHEDRKQTDADPAADAGADVAFFPLTMPFTTGPGSIAVAIALASERLRGDQPCGRPSLCARLDILQVLRQGPGFFGTVGRAGSHAIGGLPPAVHRRPDFEQRRPGHAATSSTTCHESRLCRSLNLISWRYDRMLDRQIDASIYKGLMLTPFCGIASLHAPNQ
jgi:MarC family membrane protein